MKKLFTILSFVMACVFILSACGNSKSNESSANTDSLANKNTSSTEVQNVETKKTEVVDESKIREFLYSAEGTYGWQTTADNISFDFFKDGRLPIQGPDGEATMWEGSWKLQGDQVTMVRADLGKTLTVKASIDGDKLVLGDKTYTRYKP